MSVGRNKSFETGFTAVVIGALALTGLVIGVGRGVVIVVVLATAVFVGVELWRGHETIEGARQRFGRSDDADQD